jgi:hypothetical protein
MKAPKGMEIYGLHVRAQALPIDRVRKLRRNPAAPPTTKPRRIFRIIVSSSSKSSIPWGLNQELQKTNTPIELRISTKSPLTPLCQRGEPIVIPL